MNDWITLTLLIIGAVTIITAVMMALVQHNYKRLLGYHAVSQVGYMIIGFGLGSLIGIAAGLFHMVNNTLYKTGLFLSSGNIEYRTGKENIDDLGGLSKVMPITFISTLIFALSISGIPPLNGFASKWMIYQGIVEFGKGTGIANQMWILWLGLAVLGSALTLASFIKFVGGIFLGRKLVKFDNIKEVPVLMWAPTIFIALLCVLFGVFATNYIVPELIMPVSGEFTFIGFWESGFVSILILLSILLGILIYLAGNLKKFRTDDSFVGGGEKMQELADFSAPEFYKTFGEYNILAWIYKKADEKWFDIYDVKKKAVLWFSNLFSKAHTGLLHDYALWILIGLIIMLIVLI
jgi:formate hydrogenlyase subunit 3/multisubunit Na+/H+ antiporter MnhD subunit